METHLSATHPGLWERLAFFFERWLRMQAIGQSSNPDFTLGSSPISRLLTEDELAESEVIRLSSAVQHLQWGITHSRWSGDSYLERLQQATPKLRSKALAEYGLSEAGYQEWLEQYGQPPVAVH